MQSLFYSLLLLLSKSLGNKQANVIIKVTVINLLVPNNLSHFAGVTASPEINEHNNSINKQDNTNTK